MEFWIRALLIAIVAYFCGCFNGAVIISNYILHDDVRNHGSGNAGLTNFLRTFGGPLTFVVVLTDVLKAVIAVLFGMLMVRGVTPPAFAQSTLPVIAKYWAGGFCLLGHMFPCMFHFRGGKGVLSGGTIAIMIDWRVAIVVWGGFLILTALTRYVSLGSIYAGVAFPFVSLAVYRDLPIFLLSAVIGGLLVWAHRGNLKRLVAGTEHKLTFKKHRDKGE